MYSRKMYLTSFFIFYLLVIGLDNVNSQFPSRNLFPKPPAIDEHQQGEGNKPISHWTRHIVSLDKSDFIIKSSEKPLNEKFEILRKALLFSVILPSQEINCENIAQYSEDIHVSLIKVSNGEENTVAIGNYTDYVEFNKEITIPLITADEGTPILFPTPGNNYYLVEIRFGREGYYPWFNDRRFSNSFVFASSSDKPGLIMGFEYNLSF